MYQGTTQVSSKATMHPELLAYVPLLRCPTCGGDEISAEGQSLRCPKCRARYEPRQGIPTCCNEAIMRTAFLTDLDAVDANARVSSEVTKANAIYHNCAASTYEADNLAVRTISATGDRRIREFLQWLKSEGAQGPFMDFGTGTGHMVGLAKDLFEPRLGLDISGGMLALAMGKNLPVLLADCCNPPVADGSVGVVVAYSFLHHFKEPQEVLDQMLRVLRPGGWLMVDWEPNGHARPRFLSRFVSWLIHPELWFKPRTYQQSEKVAKVNALAEYHEVLGSGLDAERLASHLTHCGCNEVRIVYHSNCASALKPRVQWRTRVRAMLDVRWPSARSSASVFLLLARRGSAR